MISIHLVWLKNASKNKNKKYLDNKICLRIVKGMQRTSNG